MKNLKLFRAWTLAVAIPFGIQSANAVVNIQNVGAGARSASLGNSYVAIADDADAVFANPAGLGQLSNTQMAYTNVSLLYTGIEGDDLGQHVVSFAKPMGNFGIGLGYYNDDARIHLDGNGFNWSLLVGSEMLFTDNLSMYFGGSFYGMWSDFGDNDWKWDVGFTWWINDIHGISIDYQRPAEKNMNFIGLKYLYSWQ